VNSIIGSASVWIGATDRAAEGTFLWVTGEPFGGYTHWIPGEPNNSGAGGVDEDCVEVAGFLAGVEQWNDTDCALARDTVCERE